MIHIMGTDVSRYFQDESWEILLEYKRCIIFDLPPRQSSFTLSSYTAIITQQFEYLYSKFLLQEIWYSSQYITHNHNTPKQKPNTCS